MLDSGNLIKQPMAALAVVIIWGQNRAFWERCSALNPTRLDPIRASAQPILFPGLLLQAFSNFCCIRHVPVDV